MRFDDRLATVLSQPVSSPHDHAVRWRQLVDLVARAHGNSDRALLERAIALIRTERPAIGEPIRAAAVRSIAGSPIPLALLMVFATDKIAVVAPLIASAALSGDALAEFRAAASTEIRRFLDSLNRPPDVEPPVVPSEPEPPLQSGPEMVPSISEVVARIERLRSSRAQSLPSSTEPSAIEVETPRTRDYPVPALFRWECGAGGEIEWVEGAPRGPLIGRSIASANPDERVDKYIERAFVLRAPFRDCLFELSGDGLMAGEWQLSGAPAFATGDGRFIGYRGIAQRGQPEPDPPPARVDGRTPTGNDALREMIHEIKTPLNAIIGFAEMIDGQYFGPAHRRYRERAAEIVVNASSLLEAAEDLDFVAKLQSARAGAGKGTDFAIFLPSFIDTLRARAASLGVILDVDVPDAQGICVLEPDLIERLLRRFTEAILTATARGERMTLQVRRQDDRLKIGVTRPSSTIFASKDDLLDPEFTISGADNALLGLGFSLRLINGLVGIAGGDLDIEDSQFFLSVPLKAD